MTKEQKKQGFFKRIFSNMRHKYKLTIMDESTMEELLLFRLSRLNVLIVLVLLSSFLVVSTIFIIAVTPLKEYIPGYASVEKVKQVYVNNLRIDSLERAIEARDLYLKNFKEIILEGKNPTPADSAVLMKKSGLDYENIAMKHSVDDSLLRMEWEDRERYDLVYYPDKTSVGGINSFIFFSPIRGKIISGFNAKKGHYGIDILGDQDAAIKATLDGIVILSSWTYETGYVIAIQHFSNLISVYKHNSVLLKHEGDPVQAGDPIAIIGNSGEFSSGPHLHFELWYNLNPVNPADFVTF
ncbi:MAG: M23 family metallopeptidase [Bacteroidales bacterium]|nr:M23 family metallopeptidase [Bacteroidales bacterium]